MAKKSNKQKQKQKQSLTNIIKIALDRKRSSGRKRPVRRTPTSQEQMAQMAQQQLLNQLLTSNQPVRTGPSILDRTFQEERLRNIERELKATNELARRPFFDGTMAGKTAQELLTPPQTPKKEEPTVGIPPPPVLTPRTQMAGVISDMKDFLKEYKDLIPKGRRFRDEYTDEIIDRLQANRVQELYNETRKVYDRKDRQQRSFFGGMFDDPKEMMGEGGGGGMSF